MKHKRNIYTHLDQHFSSWVIPGGRNINFRPVGNFAENGITMYIE